MMLPCAWRQYKSQLDCDVGLYHCDCTLAGLNYFLRIHIKIIACNFVNIAGQLTLTPSNISVTEGSNITLQCGPVNRQYGVKIFFKDDKPEPIDQSRLSSVKEVDKLMSVFTYTAVEAEENGAMIVCSIIDDTHPSAPVPLTVWCKSIV